MSQSNILAALVAVASLSATIVVGAPVKRGDDLRSDSQKQEDAARLAWVSACEKNRNGEACADGEARYYASMTAGRPNDKSDAQTGSQIAATKPTPSESEAAWRAADRQRIAKLLAAAGSTPSPTSDVSTNQPAGHQ